MQLALRLDPKSPILRTNLGWIHYMSRDYPLALSEITPVVREKPDFLTAHYKLWYIYSAQHDQVRAWQEFEWIAGAGYEQLKDATLVAYRARGYTAALKAFAQDPELSSESMVERARFLVCAGDNKRALEMLERAHQAHEGWLVFVSQDPIFDPLHSNPIFTQLTANLGSAANRQLLTSLTMPSQNSSLNNAH
jgi:tetratricopeptide (TPR) repeat protein